MESSNPKGIRFGYQAQWDESESFRPVSGTFAVVKADVASVSPHATYNGALPRRCGVGSAEVGRRLGSSVSGVAPGRLPGMWVHAGLLALGLMVAPSAVTAQERGAPDFGARPAVVPPRPVAPRLPAEPIEQQPGAVPGPGGVGVIEPGGGEPLPFDPKRLGEPDAGMVPIPGDPAAGILPTPTDDMITFKSNFDKDIKCKKLPLNAKINLDFQDASLEDLIKFFGCLTEKNFIMTAGVGKGKQITIMAPNPVTVYEGYRAFLSALEINGLTLVPSGKFLKIEDVGKAKTDTLPIYRNNQAVPDEERFVTRLVQLEHVSADEVLQMISKFKTQQGDISTYPPTNTLIITDTGTNLRRMLGLLKELDVPTGKERVWLRQIEHADATELVDKLQQIFQDQDKANAGAAAARATAAARARLRAAQQARGGQEGAAPAAGGSEESSEGTLSVSKIMADTRTNQLIIVANRASYFKLDKLIRKLDVPIPGEGQIHIHYLENADADEISSTLSSLTQGGANARSGGARTTAPRTRATTGAAGAAAGGASGAALFEGEIKISPHKETNSLVIEASLKDYLNLKKVIQKLDIRRKQVYVEAVIMEITSTKGRNLGLSGSAGTTFDIDGEEVPLLFGAGGLGISSFDLGQLQKGGLAVGMQGPLVDIDPGSAARLGGNLSLPTFGFLVQAIQSNSDVNILSTPHILTTDNEEAEIQVGKQIPYRSSSIGGLGSLGGLGALGGLGSSLGGTSTTGGLTSGLGALGALGGLAGLGTTQYVDVDLTLKITPHINESDFVRLEIDQEIEDVESLDPTLGPTTSRRKVTNTVVVRDQQPVVIGGLIRETESEGVDKVPFLGDIPVLGYLFRKTVRNTEKKNLLMVIIPTIISDPSDLKRIHENRMEEMRKFADLLATKKQEYLGNVDYRKKSGLLEEMYKTVNQARTDRELLEKSSFQDSEFDIIGPPETHDIEYDPYEAEKERQTKRNQSTTTTPKVTVSPNASEEAPPAEPTTDVPPTQDWMDDEVE